MFILPSQFSFMNGTIIAVVHELKQMIQM